jgi:hypothetical protein
MPTCQRCAGDMSGPTAPLSCIGSAVVLGDSILPRLADEPRECGVAQRGYHHAYRDGERCPAVAGSSWSANRRLPGGGAA